MGKFIFKMFENVIPSVATITESIDIKGDKTIKSTKEIIEEIHETFYTEVDRLLAEAKISNSLETNKQELIDKRDRLIKLGFTNTKEVQEADIEINRLNKLKHENKNKENLIEAINYFSFNYLNISL